MSGIEPKHLQSVERYTLSLGALVMAGTYLLGSRATSLAAAVGVGLMALNAYSIRKIAERVQKAGGQVRAGAAVLLFNLKMFALIGMVFVAVKVLGLDAVGFLLGVSVFPLAIVLAALKMNLDDEAPEPDATPRSPDTTNGVPSHGENR